MLGVEVHSDMSTHIKLNFMPLIEKIKGILEIWGNGRLMLMGRVLIVNTLVESLFVHKMQCIELLPKYLYTTFHTLIKCFIWEGKRPTISYNSLAADKSQCGLRLVDLRAKHKTILLSWIPLCLNDEFFTCTFCENVRTIPGDYVFKINVCKRDVKKLTNERTFWLDIFKSWCEINFISVDRINEYNVLNQSLWCNSTFGPHTFKFASNKSWTSIY